MKIKQDLITIFIPGMVWPVDRELIVKELYREFRRVQLKVKVVEERTLLNQAAGAPILGAEIDIQVENLPAVSELLNSLGAREESHRKWHLINIPLQGEPGC